MAAIVAGAIAAPGPLAAADDNYCRYYANDAAAQKKKNIFWRCGFRGSRWQATWQEHHRWCRGVQRYHAERERKARYAALGTARLYIENNTSIALQIEIASGRHCTAGGCGTLQVRGLTRRTVEGFLPLGPSKVRVTPMSAQMRRQVRTLHFNFYVTNRGTKTCRQVKRLVLTDRSFGKSAIIGQGSQTVFASRVINFRVGNPAPARRYAAAGRALGRPDYRRDRSEFGYVSLGCGGQLTLGFGRAGGGLAVSRIRVHEIGPAVEPTQVDVYDGRVWRLAGRVGGSVDTVSVSPPRPVYSVRLTDLRRNCGGASPGADIDAVALIGGR